MVYNYLMIRFGEFTLKGRNLARFEKRILSQVQQALEPWPAVSLLKPYGRLYVALNGEAYEPIANRLKDIFGIVSLSPMLRIEPSLERIQEAALDLMRASGSHSRSFKVSVRRVWKEFPHDTQQLQPLIGSYVLRHLPELTVDVRKPQVDLRVEIHKDAALVFNEIIPAAGGFPSGSNGKALLLLSGGIDSPVAGWHALRKGLQLEAVHFYSFPYTSEQAKDKVIALTSRLAYFAGRPIRLHLVPFTDIQTSFVGIGRDTLMITLMRRAMLRITEQIAELEGALAVVTGENLGQVASQTLPSMNVIGRVAKLPLLRPLIMQDKQEIIDTARRIQTYETSILPYEDCCTLFVPKSPSTNPNPQIINKIESRIEGLQQMLELAVANREVMELKPQASSAVRTGQDDWF